MCWKLNGPLNVTKPQSWKGVNGILLMEEDMLMSWVILIGYFPPFNMPVRHFCFAEVLANFKERGWSLLTRKEQGHCKYERRGWHQYADRGHLLIWERYSMRGRREHVIPFPIWIASSPVALHFLILAALHLRLKFFGVNLCLWMSVWNVGIGSRFAASMLNDQSHDFFCSPNRSYWIPC